MFKTVLIYITVAVCATYASSKATILTYQGFQVSEVGHYKLSSKLYKRACNLNSGNACYNLANSFTTGQGVAKNLHLAAKYFQKACSLKIAQSCTSLGFAYAYGHGVHVNHPKAISFFKKACKLGDIYACNDYMSLQKK